MGPAIGGMLAVYSFRWLFLVDGTTSILAGVVLVLAPMRTWDAKRHTSRSGWTRRTWAAKLKRRDVRRWPRCTPSADLRAFRNPRMLYFLAALIPVQIGFFQLTSTLPLFLVRNLHLTGIRLRS